jgi:hypothetical protein
VAQNISVSEAKRQEAIWRERARIAEEKYSAASAHCCQIQADYAGEHLPSADGNDALQQALKAETEARAEYMHVLHILSRLLVAGEIPDEP